MKSLAALVLLPLLALAQDRDQDRTRTFTDAVCTATLASPTATTTAMAALSMSDGDCPQSALLTVHYHEDNGACCTQLARLTEMADGGLACCPCGALCTGTAPPVQDWTFSDGQFVTSDGSGTATPTGTAEPTVTEAAASRHNLGFALGAGVVAVAFAAAM